MFMLALVVSKYWPNPNLLPFYRISEFQGWTFSESANPLVAPNFPQHTNIFQFLWKAELMEDLYMIPPKIPDRESFGNAMFWHTMATWSSKDFYHSSDLAVPQNKI